MCQLNFISVVFALSIASLVYFSFYTHRSRYETEILSPRGTQIFFDSNIIKKDMKLTGLTDRISVYGGNESMLTNLPVKVEEFQTKITFDPAKEFKRSCGTF